MGNKGPEKEPDYHAEKAAFASGELARRQQQADAYNAQVNSFNDAMSRFLNQANSIYGDLQQKTIRDVGTLTGYDTTLSNLAGAAGSSFSASQPFFDSVAQSPWGAVQVGTPSLNMVDNNSRTRLDSAVTSAQGLLNNLRTQRTAEEKRIEDFRTGLLTELGSIGSSLDQASIADQGLLSSLASSLSDIDTRRNTFASTILDQVRPGGFTTVLSNYDTQKSKLDDLLSARAAEEGRIEDYRTGLQSSRDSFADRLLGLTIADESGLTNLKRDIDNRQLDASRFTSELGFNFNDSLNNIQSLEDQLDLLFQDRTNELSRIASTSDAARQGAFNIENQLDSAGIYNRASLDQMMRAISEAQNELTNFDSELTFDFSDPLSRLTASKEGVQTLLNRRADKLGGYNSEIEALRAALDGTELYDESGFNDIIGDASSLSGALSRFSGSDSNELNYSIEDLIASAEGRLGDLGDYRDTFEKDLQSEYDALTGRSFNELSDLTSSDARLAELRDLVDLYGVDQARDELGLYEDRLNSERSRIQQAMAASANSPLGQVSSMLSALTGGSSPLTPEQYLALLSSIDDEEKQGITTGYAQNILRL